ncbi:hypothetical protein BDF19DRAFT_219081 [Syncephalis fuscata]|nr:hypothetical protein BDF19DRAFT_219081 [Syncephalis fuscata]
MKGLFQQSIFTRISVLFFVLFALFQHSVDAAYPACNYQALSVTAPAQVAEGNNTIEWTVREDLRNAYFVFNVELWSSSGSGGQPAVQRKEVSIGQARTGANTGPDGKYSLTGKVPKQTPGPKTTYFIAVYGHQYINGPAFTSIHPWDPVYYGTKDVTLQKA